MNLESLEKLSFLLPISGGSLLDRATSLQAALKQALSSPSFLPKGGKIGFFCHNTYQEAALAKANAKLAEGGFFATFLPRISVALGDLYLLASTVS